MRSSNKKSVLTGLWDCAVPQTRWARWFAVLGFPSDSCDRQTQGDVTENVIETPCTGNFYNEIRRIPGTVWARWLGGLRVKDDMALPSISLIPEFKAACYEKSMKMTEILNIQSSDLRCHLIQFPVPIISGALLVAEPFSNNTSWKRTKSYNAHFTAVVSRYY